MFSGFICTFAVMINLTPLFRSHFLSRLQQQVRYIDHADAVQQGELVRLIEKASLTRFGRKYDFSSIRTYRQFASTLPRRILAYHRGTLDGRRQEMVVELEAPCILR